MAKIKNLLETAEEDRREDLDVYKSYVPDLEKFCNKLREAIQDILEVNDIDYSIVECRVKTPESVSKKLSRPGKSYKGAFELTDLVGIRVLLFFDDDVEKVSRLIAQEFDVDDVNSMDKLHSLGESEFGYRSIHQIIELGSTRKDLPEWSKYAGLKVEIQVRTILQHAWAAINHKLSYKTLEGTPSELKRGMSKLSALLEIADEQFVQIRDAQGKYKNDLAKALKTDSKSIELNIDSLRGFVLNKSVLATLGDLAKGLGFVVEDRDEVSLITSDYLHQAVNIIRRKGIQTLGAFEKILFSDKKLLRKFLANLSDIHKNDSHGLWRVSNGFILLLLVIFLFKDQVQKDELLLSGWGGSVLDTVFKAIDATDKQNAKAEK